MLKGINYKRKNQLLLAVIALAIVVIYNLSITKTIEKYKEYTGLKDKIKTVSVAPKAIDLLRDKIADINRFFGKSSDNSISKRAQLIDYTSEYCKSSSLSLRLISEPVYQYKDKILIETNTLILQGSFINMIKFISSTEKHQNIGKISSLSFYKEKNIRTKKEKLLLQIFIQNIINNTDEKNT